MFLRAFILLFLASSLSHAAAVGLYECKLAVTKILPGLIEGKKFIKSYLRDKNEWEILSEAGNGNCGECIEMAQHQLVEELGPGAEIIPEQRFISFLDRPPGLGHGYLSVITHKHRKRERFIIDFTWSQFFTNLEEIKSKIPIVFVGTEEDLKKRFQKHKKFLQDSLYGSRFFSFNELFELFYGEIRTDSQAASIKAIYEKGSDKYVTELVSSMNTSGEYVELAKLDYVLVPKILQALFKNHLEVELSQLKPQKKSQTWVKVRRGFIESAQAVSISFKGKTYDLSSRSEWRIRVL